MKKNEVGSLNSLFFPLIGVSALLVFSLIFAVWAFIGRQDYKNNSDQKAEAVSQVAVDKAVTAKDNEFVEKEKSPLRNYKAESVLGAITFDYPKTWGGYSTSNGNDLKLLMNPGIVSGADKTVYALKVEVLTTTYDNSLKQFESNIKTGKIKAQAFRLGKVQSALGTRLDGEVNFGQNGSAVLLPLRDKTLKISTESQEFVNDFNTIILPGFSFSP